LFGFDVPFDGRTFAVGTFDSDFVTSEDNFLQLAPDAAIIISFIKEPTTTLMDISFENEDGSVVNEPEELISNINKKLLENKLPIEFSVDEHDVTIEITSKEKENKIQFSKDLNHLFGLDEEHIFLGSEEYAFTRKFNFERGNEKLIFLSNVVRNQYYGDGMQPVLRVAAKPASTQVNKEVHLKFEPIIYLPLSTTPIREIFVKIVTESGSLASVSNRPLTLVLHIRRRSV
jgi:hypothetical protein